MYQKLVLKTLCVFILFNIHTVLCSRLLALLYSLENNVWSNMTGPRSQSWWCSWNSNPGPSRTQQQTPHTPKCSLSTTHTFFLSVIFLNKYSPHFGTPHLASWFPVAQCRLHSLGPIHCPLLLPGHWWPPIT